MVDMQDNEKLTKDEMIYANTERIVLALDMMRKDYNKIIYALMGMVAATIGIKFIGTPWYIDLSTFFTLGAGVFLLGVLIGQWKSFSINQRITRIIISLFMLFVAITQIFVYRIGDEIPPEWFPPMTHLFFVAIAVCITISTWKMRLSPKDKNKKANIL